VTRRQVFGLFGREAYAGLTYWPSLPSSPEPVRDDGGRSRLPLRGSSGLSPDSLLPLRLSGAPTQQR
jgi:hypothetical protein